MSYNPVFLHRRGVRRKGCDYWLLQVFDLWTKVCFLTVSCRNDKQCNKVRKETFNNQ